MIYLTKMYAIDADDKQYILVERKLRTKEDKTIESYWAPLGFYRTVPQALESLSRHMHREARVRT